MTTENLTTQLQEEEVPVKIYLNNGTVRYGFVVNSDKDTTNGTFGFISSEKIKNYHITRDNCLIESLYPHAITAIDAYLK
jgi:hypothetical protein